MNNTYSQLAEDILIDYYLGNPRIPGVYLDIGCCWAEKFSNTYRFYKKGWRGLCVDPNPEVAAEYAEKRPLDVFVNSGVGSEEGTLAYTMFENPVFNTFSQANVDRVLAGKGGGRVLTETREIKIKPAQLIIDEVRKQHDWFQQIDFLSLDVEGFELSVLKSIDFKINKPKLIAMELFVSDPMIIQKNATAAYLFDQGYKLVGFTGHDCFFRLK